MLASTAVPCVTFLFLRTTRRQQRPRSLHSMAPPPPSGEPSQPSGERTRVRQPGEDLHLPAPDTAVLSLLSDKLLGRALAHHKLVLQVPSDWWKDPGLSNCQARQGPP
mmetsp:Transcript_61806/g.127788  ORF Transcript_61806/g.127788 Transcript_61806/m.127788 type:complete len:108 (-) Transcript_61806:201-524(-)